MLLTRRTALLSPLLCCAPALAADSQLGPAFGEPFSADSFAAAQKAGRTILIDVTASWCPTCRQQKYVLEQLQTEKRFWDVVVLVIDYDKQKDLMRKFSATSQGTLIVFKGSQERGRLVLDTNADRISHLLQSGL